MTETQLKPRIEDQIKAGLLDDILARIDAVDGQVKSYLLVMADAARAAARQAEQEIAAGKWRGPLHGIPYAVKDNYFTKGVRTCAASRLLLDHVPDFNATGTRLMRLVRFSMSRSKSSAESMVKSLYY